MGDGEGSFWIASNLTRISFATLFLAPTYSTCISVLHHSFSPLISYRKSARLRGQERSKLSEMEEKIQTQIGTMRRRRSRAVLFCKTSIWLSLHLLTPSSRKTTMTIDKGGDQYSTRKETNCTRHSHSKFHCILIGIT